MTHQFITWLNAQHFDKPMVEAVGKIFHACFESAKSDHYVSKTYNELIDDVNSIIKNKWDDLLGIFTRTGEFVFQCNDTHLFPANIRSITKNSSPSGAAPKEFFFPFV